MEKELLEKESSFEMTETAGLVFLVESFLEENFQFRRNLLMGKTEVRLRPMASAHCRDTELDSEESKEGGHWRKQVAETGH